MLSNKELRDKYDIDLYTTSSYALLYSYGNNPHSPIVFKHFVHDHNISSEIKYQIDRNYCSLYIFLTGKFSFMFDNSVYNPSFGDIVLIRNGEKALSCFYQNTFVDYYEINFPMEFFETLGNKNPFYSPFYSRDLGEKNMVKLSTLNCDKMLQKLKNIENLATSMDEDLDFLGYSYIIQIMGLVNAQFSKEGSRSLSFKIPTKLKEAVDYIHLNFTTLISIDEVATHCHITNTYLSRMFKSFLQCTPNEYLTNLRISHAKYLLDQGSSVTDACYKAGFNSYSYFISKFKSITGITPLQFKKST